MYCPFCGIEVGEEFVFCPSCGRRLPNKAHGVVEEPIRHQPVAQNEEVSLEHQVCVSPLQALIWFFTRWTFEGRSSRSEVWWVFLFLRIPILLISFFIWGVLQSPFTVYLGLILFVPTMFLQVRRFHDIERSVGWLYALYIVDLVYALLQLVLIHLAWSMTNRSLDFMQGWAFLLWLVELVFAGIVLCCDCYRSKPHANKYGPVPNVLVNHSHETKSGGKKVLVCVSVCLAILLVVIAGWGISAYRTKQATRQFLAAYKAERYEVAARLIKRVDSSNVRVQFALGTMYGNGLGVMSNDVKSVTWFRHAAEQGDADSQYSLGLIYDNGRGVIKDEVEAAKWYRKAADQGNETAQFMLGLSYATGSGVVKDETAAVMWFRKAADRGHEEAQFMLGMAYEAGVGVAKDEVEAAKWYRKAAEQGNAKAQCNLGVAYANGRGVAKDEAEAVKWYRKAAEQGDATAQLKLWIMYESGLGVSKDKREAMKWCRKAAEQGDAIAQGRLGLSFEIGELGVKDEAEATKWYRKAAEQGNYVAQYSLGVMYEHGKGVTKDAVEAVKWYRKAAEQGHDGAQSNLAWMYEHGSGVVQNDMEAVKWYCKAAEQGNMYAQNNLGVLYEYGKGVTKDEVEAVKWYRKSAEQGNKNAQEKLERLERIANGKPQHGDTKTLTLPGGAAMELVYVSPGSFMMGSNTGLDNEKPVHKVTLTKGFWMGKYEVTQAQWKSVMGNNPSRFKGDDRPVDCVSWYDCQKFISKVNEQLEVGSVRLPTEAEWEYVCRAGTKGDFGGRKLDDIGWYNNGNNGSGTHIVGVKHANDWGFYDMHGNVREWCDDWYGDYPTGAVINPVGASFRSYRVARGGCWHDYAMGCTSSCRSSDRPSVEFSLHYFGFRLCCSAELSEKVSH